MRNFCNFIGLEHWYFILIWNTVNLVLSGGGRGRGGLFISRPFVGDRLNRDGGLIWEGGAGLFNLETTMVSVLHKELEWKVEKLKYRKVEHHAAEDQNQMRSSSW